MNDDYKQRLADAVQALNALAVEAAREGYTVEVFCENTVYRLNNIACNRYAANLTERI